MLWSYILATFGVLGIYLTGNKNKWGFAIGVFSQLLWIAYAITTEQYGFIIASMAYGWSYARGYRKWTAEEKAADV